MPDLRFIPLTLDQTERVNACAQILVNAFAEHWPEAWPTLEEAQEEIRGILEDEDGFIRVAVDEDDTVLGWIGGMAHYEGNVYELHPLAVNPAAQGRGVGRALVADFEAQALARGADTIMVLSDDVDSMTNLSGIDLYPRPFEHLSTIRNLKGHPYEFYQKQGYALSGIIPDANGFGKPDLLLTKRLRKLS